MIIYDGLNAPGLKRLPRVLAVGAFDGVHRGHQRLLSHVCRMAAEYGVEAAIMTFEPIPAQVFRDQGHENTRLSTKDERNKELVKYCVGSAVVVRFDEAFRRTSAYEFARDILVQRLGVVALVASKTHSFGRDAEADVQRITELGMDLGFEVHVLPPILVDGRRINSTDVRRLLWAGDVAAASDWLGRPYDLAGKVVPGRHIGRTIGFPTANLRPVPEKLVPGDGVYACAARIEPAGAAQTEWAPAAVSIGNTPTVGDGGRTIEAHLIHPPSRDLTGETMRLLFLARVRDNHKFDSVDALTRQIERDVRVTRREFDGRDLSL